MMTQVNKKKYLELDESQIKGKRDPGHFLGPIIIKRFKKLIKKKKPKAFRRRDASVEGKTANLNVQFQLYI